MTYVNHVFQGHILVTPYAKLWTVKKYILIKKKKKGNIFLVLFSHFLLFFFQLRRVLNSVKMCTLKPQFQVLESTVSIVIYFLLSQNLKNGRNIAFYSQNKIIITCRLVYVLAMKAFI